MTVDCIDCIETCAAAKTVVEEANDRSLFDVPKLKAHFTTTFIEVTFESKTTVLQLY